MVVADLISSSSDISDMSGVKLNCEVSASSPLVGSKSTVQEVNACVHCDNLMDEETQFIRDIPCDVLLVCQA